MPEKQGTLLDQNKEQEILDKNKALAELSHAVEPVKAEAQDLVIKDDEGLEKAKDMIRDRNTLLKEIDATFKPIKQKIDAAKNEALGQEKAHKGPVQESKEIITDKVSTYLTKKEAEAKRLAEEAAEKARKEHERKLAALNKQIEKMANDAEDINAQIINLEKALEDSKDEDEATLLRSRLQGLYAQRDKKVEALEDKAARAEEVATAPDPATVAPGKPTGAVKGLVKRTNYEVRVLNAMALVKAIADGRIPITAIKTWDEKALENLHKAGVTIPGVSVKAEAKYHAR